MSNWWQKDMDIPYGSKSFRNIVTFFLFYCPVDQRNGNVSQRAKTFKERGLTNSNLNTLMSKMKQNSVLNKNAYQVVKQTDDVAQFTNRIINDTRNVDPNCELIVYIEDEYLKKTKSVFYYIRNAFAHGSFSMAGKGKDRIYYFESLKGEKVKAQIRLRETTLLGWIDLVNSFKVTNKDKDKEKRRIERDKAI